MLFTELSIWCLEYHHARIRRDISVNDSQSTTSNPNSSTASSSTLTSKETSSTPSATSTPLPSTASTASLPTTTTPKEDTDEHNFYVTQLFDNFDRFWIELYYGEVNAATPANISSVHTNMAATIHEKLSVSYRTAAVIDLKFTFPFYGQPVKRVVIATGGFIYVGEVLNPRLLTFSQFIAPLMANFDFSSSDFDSKRLLYFSNETMLVVEWRDVGLQEHPSMPFRFQVHIYSSGKIVFAYNDIPVCSLFSLPSYIYIYICYLILFIAKC